MILYIVIRDNITGKIYGIYDTHDKAKYALKKADKIGVAGMAFIEKRKLNKGGYNETIHN